MNIKTILKSGIPAIITLGILVSCSGSNRDDAATREIISESGNSPDMGFLEEKNALRNSVMTVINDFNQKANDIKVNAYKTSTSLDEEVKKMLVKIEGQVITLEERMGELNRQSEETWPAYKKSLIQELDNIRSNIQVLAKTGTV
ncbi:MAG: hypothetical protein JXB00_16095 [Bacteroidales bacterium]|nr:hypothetical protein [Bacteroidales bacterium]